MCVFHQIFAHIAIQFSCFMKYFSVYSFNNVTYWGEKNSLNCLVFGFQHVSLIILSPLHISIKGESRFVCGGSGCGAEWTFAEVCKMALLDPQERQYFQKTMEFNAARQTLTAKLCPGCGSAVTRENGSDLNVLCKKCTAVKGRPFEFCWQCLREWKGARPRKDRCENLGCCNPSLETLIKCPNITFDSVKECPSVRACPTCGLLLEHSKKLCKFVDCPRCNVLFCFVCLKCSGECWRTRCTPAPRQTSIPVWQKK
uniref:RING-type domain-containing protein n=1 Tax=Oreochromis niloticus TaxID=8128 RepID=A0A669BQH2_ORENI